MYISHISVATAVAAAAAAANNASQTMISNVFIISIKPMNISTIAFMVGIKDQGPRSSVSWSGMFCPHTDPPTAAPTTRLTEPLLHQVDPSRHGLGKRPSALRPAALQALDALAARRYDTDSDSSNSGRSRSRSPPLRPHHDPVAQDPIAGSSGGDGRVDDGMRPGKGHTAHASNGTPGVPAPASPGKQPAAASPGTVPVGAQSTGGVTAAQVAPGTNEAGRSARGDGTTCAKGSEGLRQAQAGGGPAPGTFSKDEGPGGKGQGREGGGSGGEEEDDDDVPLVVAARRRSLHRHNPKVLDGSTDDSAALQAAAAVLHDGAAAERSQLPAIDEEQGGGPAQEDGEQAVGSVSGNGSGGEEEGSESSSEGEEPPTPEDIRLLRKVRQIFCSLHIHSCPASRIDDAYARYSDALHLVELWKRRFKKHCFL